MRLPKDEPKPLLDHLEELRWTLLKSAGALGAWVIICFLWTRPILSWFLAPLRVAGLEPSRFLRVLGVLDPFTIQLEVSLFAGIICSLPWVLYFVGKFILPALTPKEARWMIPFFVGGGLLFVGGVLFCYYLLLPQTLRFFFDYGRWLQVETQWTLTNYLSFVCQMLLGFGLAFELPLVVLAANAIGILPAERLRSYRRHAFVVVVVAAACLTPGSDPFSLALLSIPMYLLYEACIWIAWWRERYFGVGDEAGWSWEEKSGDELL
ncbi:twin-arginine translocase subunit TatC [Candidatus Methylacidithermus pantelleriae]|uniref:Sec-independent protein translocase protein TatC n=1 Tax=Candidatus Methylacidithermus pantelleriae TaxID=2744239 RepID=A0A8J2BLJ3_9BACT|nr:twin-arginine translocase subunit TatC [Candidatus Methylacidithermus pantelleriae]CAF0696343.1 Sec-independent protein translocase protein TatC [Candidatus Methylacidithermus pantelleriae]